MHAPFCRKSGLPTRQTRADTRNALVRFGRPDTLCHTDTKLDAADLAVVQAAAKAARLADAQQARAGFTVTYGPEHPDTRKCQSQLVVIRVEGGSFRSSRTWGRNFLPNSHDTSLEPRRAAGFFSHERKRNSSTLSGRILTEGRILDVPRFPPSTRITTRGQRHTHSSPSPKLWSHRDARFVHVCV